MVGRNNDGWSQDEDREPRFSRDPQREARPGDRNGESRSFERGPWSNTERGVDETGPRYGAGGYTGYTGRGVTGGYGQNGSDPGTRISPYGDRLYRGGAGGGEPAGAAYGPAGYEYGAVWPGAPADPGHRGLGPQGYRRSDARISEDVHDRLTEDAHIDASAIVVSVQDGEVTLTGSVRERRAKHHAEAIIEHIAGVGHVQNNLRVDANLGRGPAPLGENTVLRDQAEGEKP